jgi:hypothetical protein
MYTAGFETAISAIKWPRTHALESKVTGIGMKCIADFNISAKKPYKCPEVEYV